MDTVDCLTDPVIRLVTPSAKPLFRGKFLTVTKRADEDFLDPDDFFFP